MYELALHRKYRVLVAVGVYESPASPTLLPPEDAVVYQPLAVNPVRAAGVGRVNAVPPSMKSSVNGEIAVPPFVVALKVVTNLSSQVTFEVLDVEVARVGLPE